MELYRKLGGKKTVGKYTYKMVKDSPTNLNWEVNAGKGTELREPSTQGAIRTDKIINLIYFLFACLPSGYIFIRRLGEGKFCTCLVDNCVSYALF